MSTYKAELQEMIQLIHESIDAAGAGSRAPLIKQWRDLRSELKEIELTEELEAQAMISDDGVVSFQDELARRRTARGEAATKAAR